MEDRLLYNSLLKKDQNDMYLFCFEGTMNATYVIRSIWMLGTWNNTSWFMKVMPLKSISALCVPINPDIGRGWRYTQEPILAYGLIPARNVAKPLWQARAWSYIIAWFIRAWLERSSTVIVATSPQRIIRIWSSTYAGSMMVRKIVVPSNANTAHHYTLIDHHWNHIWPRSMQSSWTITWLIS